mgnify:CR=1 FL=1
MARWSEKLKAAFKHDAATVDPAVFGSELAQKTGWEPIGGASASFCTHRLKIDPMYGTMRFVGTVANLLIGFVIVVFIAFLVFILGQIPLSAVPSLGNACRQHPFLYAVFALGLIPAILGCWLFRKMSPWIVFDTQNGAFFVAPGNPQRIADVTALKNYTPFREIGALQLLEKWVQGGKSSYMAYELNLVRKDGERVRVLCHGDYKQLAADAAALSEQLRVPLWDVKNLPESSQRKD